MGENDASNLRNAQHLTGLGSTQLLNIRTGVINYILIATVALRTILCYGESKVVDQSRVTRAP